MKITAAASLWILSLVAAYYIPTFLRQNKEGYVRSDVLLEVRNPKTREWEFEDALLSPVKNASLVEFRTQVRDLTETQVKKYLSQLAQRSRTVQGDEFILMLWRQWGRLNPSAALRSVEPASAGARAKYEDQILAGWGEVNMTDAWRWLEALWPPHLSMSPVERASQAERVSRFIDAALQDDRIESVSDLLHEMQTSLWRPLFTKKVFEYLSEVSFKDAIAALSTVNTGADREVALQVITEKISREDPHLALESVYLLPRANERRPAMITVFKSLAEAGNFSLAKSWFESERGKNKADVDSALLGYLPDLSKKDFELTKELFKLSSDTEMREPIMRATFAKLMTSSPENALDWVVINDPAFEQSENFARYIKYWKSRDLTRMNAVVASNPRLTEVQRARIIQSINSSGVVQ
ncbi:MAG: hypothetical protein ABIZ81_09530 [Opitutaceae bacterium]